MLPAELIDLIIDNAARDQGSLRACSLVCRSWARRSQINLHRRVFFAALSALELFLRFPKLLSIAEEVTVDDRCPNGRYPCGFVTIRDHNHLPEFLMAFVNPAGVSDEMTFLGPIFPSVRRVVLMRSPSYSWETFWECFPLTFPKAAYLTITPVDLTRPLALDRSTRDIPGHSGLGSLEINNMYTDGLQVMINGLISQTTIFRQIHTFRLHRLADGELEIANSILVHLQESLIRLELIVVQCSPGESIPGIRRPSVDSRLP